MVVFDIAAFGFSPRNGGNSFGDNTRPGYPTGFRNDSI
jgi:hypothetical protein